MTVERQRFLGRKCARGLQSRGFACLVCQLVLLLCYGAKADTFAGSPRGSAVELKVSPGASCLEPARLEERLGEWFGTRAVEPRLRVEVWGDPQLPRKLAFSLWQGEQKLNERNFQAAPPDCAQMHAVVALAIAIALRNTLLEDLDLVALERGPARFDLRNKTRAARTRALELSGLVGGGFGPDLNGGVDLGFAFGVRRWAQLRAGPVLVHARRGRFAGIEGAYDLTTLGVALEGCVRGQSFSLLELRVCTGPLLGGLLARGRGYAQSKAEIMAYAAWTGRATLELRLTRAWGLTVGVLGAVPLSRPRLMLRDTEGQVVRERRLERFALAGLAGTAFYF